MDVAVCSSGLVAENDNFHISRVVFTPNSYIMKTRASPKSPLCCGIPFELWISCISTRRLTGAVLEQARIRSPIVQSFEH